MKYVKKEFHSFIILLENCTYFILYKTKITQTTARRIMILRYDDLKRHGMHGEFSKSEEINTHNNICTPEELASFKKKKKKIVQLISCLLR